MLTQLRRIAQLEERSEVGSGETMTHISRMDSVNGRRTGNLKFGREKDIILALEDLTIPS